ncbi:MAG: hypothetical protein M1383_01315 [Patescibacteria group bacterium]|nr:hypothetical protein [Patescibacteria group bacterium]
MNILLIIPPYVLGEGNKAVLPHKAMLPVGALTFAARLQQHKQVVSTLDLVFQEDWQRFLPASKPDILAISCHTRRNIPVVRELLRVLASQWSSLPYTVLGGNVCAQLSIDYFSCWGVHADAVVQGFAHGFDVVDAVLSKTQGNIRPDYRFLNEDYPTPALDQIDRQTHRRYASASAGWYPIYTAALGCPYYCGYCESRMFQGLKARDYPSVIDEITRVKQLEGYEGFWAVDNLSLLDSARSYRLDQFLFHSGKIWRGMSRPEAVAKCSIKDLKQLKTLKEVAIGIETFNKGALEVFNRGAESHYLKDVEIAVTLLNRAGIVSTGFWILGSPGESEKEFCQSVQRLRAFGLKQLSWAFYNPVSAGGPADFAPQRFGFYDWPFEFGAATLNPVRIVQHAMVLSGIWWDGWTWNESEPYFETETEFGVNFLEGRLAQEKSARDAAGDIWYAWKKGRRK